MFSLAGSLDSLLLVVLLLLDNEGSNVDSVLKWREATHVVVFTIGTWKRRTIPLWASA